MKWFKISILFLFLAFSWGIGFAGNKEKKIASIDGPYVMYDGSGQMRVIRVDEKGKLQDNVYANIPKNFALDVVSNDGEQKFQVKLHPIKRPDWKAAQREKTLIISDPHGDLDCFVSVLQNNGVIGKNYEWTFGKNQLVVIGDVFDRGKDVLPICWLMYKLEQEAQEAGGVFTFMLGNHEEMVLRNNLKYSKSKYKDLAAELNMEYAELWHGESELGRWLQSRNLIQVIGDNLFVHAGLSPAFTKLNYEILAVNEEVGKSIALGKEEREKLSVMSDSIYSPLYGPFWYRGMVLHEDRYHPVTPAEIEQILKHYQVGRIFVGHTIFDNVTSFFNGKVVAVNVNNEKNKEVGRSRGMLIQKDELYLVFDKGKPQKYN